MKVFVRDAYVAGSGLLHAAAFGDVHFLCVGTPQSKGEYAADMRYVNGVVEGLAPHLDRPCVVVGKSTVPVGTAARLQELITGEPPDRLVGPRTPVEDPPAEDPPAEE